MNPVSATITMLLHPTFLQRKSRASQVRLLHVAVTCDYSIIGQSNFDTSPLLRCRKIERLQAKFVTRCWDAHRCQSVERCGGGICGRQPQPLLSHLLESMNDQL